MRITQSYPLIQVSDVAATTTFFRDWLGFRAVFEADWYVQLQSPDSPEVNLAILEAGHDTVPDVQRGVTRGLILTYEVEDTAREAARAEAAGIRIVHALKDEPHGQRHFIAEGPDGILVDIVTPIPPAEGFGEGYADDALPT